MTQRLTDQWSSVIKSLSVDHRWKLDHVTDCWYQPTPWRNNLVSKRGQHGKASQINHKSLQITQKLPRTPDVTKLDHWLLVDLCCFLADLVYVQSLISVNIIYTQNSTQYLDFLCYWSSAKLTIYNSTLVKMVYRHFGPRTLWHDRSVGTLRHWCQSVL